jgi:hypothetical protein
MRALGRRPVIFGLQLIADARDLAQDFVLLFLLLLKEAKRHKEEV